jgi:hypothetical protein
MHTLARSIAVLALSAGAIARAGPSVTLNGVPIDGVTGQRIENATVVIDEKGDIHIEAKGYAVRGAVVAPSSAARPPPAYVAPVVPPPPAVPPPAPPAASVPAPTAPAVAAAPAALTRRYFLATEHGAPGTAYDVAIFINAQWIREVKANEPQVVMEITRYLRPGANRVVMAATKRSERPSTSKDVAQRIVIGEGNIGGGHVMIESTLVEMIRTAAETENRTEEFVVQAR